MTFLQRILAAGLALVFLVAVLLFASIALGVLLALGIVVWAWLWWRSWRLPRRRGHGGGRVIEGEYRSETDLKRVREPNRPL